MFLGLDRRSKEHEASSAAAHSIAMEMRGPPLPSSLASPPSFGIP